MRPHRLHVLSVDLSVQRNIVAEVRAVGLLTLDRLDCRCVAVRDPAVAGDVTDQYG